MSDQPATSAKLHKAIEVIIRKRAVEASQMSYDRKVWISAVGEAQSVFSRVPMKDTVEAYHQAVVSALSAACDAYNDPDGEYTNGTGAIGDVLYDVMDLLSTPE